MTFDLLTLKLLVLGLCGDGEIASRVLLLMLCYFKSRHTPNVNLEPKRYVQTGGDVLIT